MALVYENPESRRGRVLRFEFSGALIDHVTAFASLHKYDDRKTYKEAWLAWLAHDEIAALIRIEVARLSALGYNGDVADKLFKSGRYYFRGKCEAKANAANAANGPNAANANRKYVLLNRQLLDAMDDHIERGLRNDTYTPASGFDDFCKTSYDESVFKSEVTRLSELMPSGEAVHAKLKKTYKNRYFTLSNKQTNN